MKQLLALAISMSMALMSFAQVELAAPRVEFRTIWGCDGEFSAKIRWSRVSGAEGYEVKTGDGNWQSIGNTTSHKFSIPKDTKIRLSVRAVKDGVAGPSGGRSVRQHTSPPCDEQGRPIVDPNNYNPSQPSQSVYSSGTGSSSHPALNIFFAEKPAIQTCLELPEGITVYGIVAGTQCQQVGPAGVGIASVIEMGIVDALDVWGLVREGVVVCFANAGSLKFLDASTAPRTVRDLKAEYADGTTCGIINDEGTVVLLASAPPPAEPPASSPQSTADTKQPAPNAFNGCKVTTTAKALNLRAGPGTNFAVLDWIFKGEIMTSTQRSGNWFAVVYRDKHGWVSGKWLTLSHGCG